jgi:Leucine-rich repeat (LRR) protein
VSLRPQPTSSAAASADPTFVSGGSGRSSAKVACNGTASAAAASSSELSEAVVLQIAEGGSHLSSVSQLIYRHKRLESLRTPGTVDFRELLSLRVLSLSHNRLVDIGPLVDLPCLVELNINNNKVEDLEPAFKCETLEVLLAASNCVVSLPSGMETAVRLRKLSLFSNKMKDIRGPALQGLSSLPELRSLDIGGNPCMGDISQRYSLINQLTNLKELDGETLGRVDFQLAKEFFDCA